MTEPASPLANQELKNRLLQAVQMPVRVAAGSKAKIRTLFLIGLVSTLWLGFFCIYSVGMSAWGALPIVLVLVIPPLILGKLYLMLDEVIDLPERIGSFFASLQNHALTIRAQTIGALSSPSSANDKRGLVGLFSMAKQLRAVFTLTSEVEELASIVGGALLLTNPFFLVVLGIGIAAVSLFTGIALITLLVFLL